MLTLDKRTGPETTLPEYLRKLILFDKLISGVTILFTAMIGAALLLIAADHQLTLGLLGGMVIFAVSLVLSI